MALRRLGGEPDRLGTHSGQRSGVATKHAVEISLSQLNENGRFWPIFAVEAVFFDQVHPQENVHAEIDEVGQESLEGRLLTIRTLDQHFSVVP